MMVIESIVYRALSVGNSDLVGTGTDLGSQLQELSGTGVFDLVLPFLLVFAIVYGLLSELGLFGDDKPNVIIALVIAAFAALFFPMGQWLMFLEGPWAMWLVLILMVMITLSLAGLDPTDGNLSKGIGAIAILGVLGLFFMGDPNVIDAIFGSGASSFELAGIPVLGDIIASLGWPLIIILLLVIGMVVWVASD